MNTMTIRMSLMISITLTVLCMSHVGYTQDAEGCQDEPLFARMKNFVIAECEQSFDAVEVTIAKDTTIFAEGDLTRIEYAHNGIADVPTAKQIKQHYATIVHELGGEVLYEEESLLTCQIVKEGKEFFIIVQTGDASYTFRILAVENLTQDTIA